jgi:hypothetical protein
MLSTFKPQGVRARILPGPEGNSEPLDEAMRQTLYSQEQSNDAHIT